MIEGKKLVIVLPAYNAELTLRKTYAEIPFDIVDEVVLVDDNSSDRTVAVGHELGISHIIKHDKNRGYGGNQKSCYKKALELGADIPFLKSFVEISKKQSYGFVCHALNFHPSGCQGKNIPHYFHIISTLVPPYFHIEIRWKGVQNQHGKIPPSFPHPFLKKRMWKGGGIIPC